MSAPEVHLESPLPAELPAGSVTAVYCAGSAWGARGPVRSLSLLVGDRAHPVGDVAMPRFDLPRRRSGFWAVVPVAMPADGAPVSVAARVDGAAEPVALATIRGGPAVGAGGGAGDAVGGGGAGGAGVVICMATFEPDEALFDAQLRSIRAQTRDDWTCVISDDHSAPEAYARIERIVGADPRFSVSRAPARIGFYRNFERALALGLARPAPLIALSDQDDVWHPDKLDALCAALGDAPLAYSDMRLVDARGRVLRDTLWTGRRNNRTDIASMLVANTITGAATLMRRDVAAAALPFPDAPGIEFHDHWIALVALGLGTPAYVDRPLYDYVQHPGAILGRVSGTRAPQGAGRGRARAPRMRDWRAAYFLGYIPGAVRARTLLERCGTTLTPRRRRALERYLAAARSPAAFAWFAARPARMLLGATETRGAESELAVGISWAWLARRVARLPGWPASLTLDCRFPDPPVFEHRRLRRWRERG